MLSNNNNLYYQLLLIIFNILIIVNSQSSTSSSSSYRIRRRCPTQFPTHFQLMNSNSIVLIGMVEYIRPLDNVDINDERYRFAQSQPIYQQPSQSSNYIANVMVRRVLHGPRSLQHQRIQVTGFHSNEQKNSPQQQQWCYSNTRQGDSWIFVLQPINYHDHFRLNSSLIKLTLSNIERFDSIISNQPYGLRIELPDLPCEKKYCANNANCINDQYANDGARCECLQHCNNAKYQPVCGSNDETYNNECEMRLRSCRANKNLFVKTLNSCYYSRRPNIDSNMITSSSSSSNYRTAGSSIPSPTTNRYNQQIHRTTTTTTSVTNDNNKYIDPSSPSVSSSSYRTPYNHPEYPLPLDNDKLWRSSSSSSTTTTNNNGNRHTVTTTINRSYSY